MLAWYRRWRRGRYLRDQLVSTTDLAQALARAPSCYGLNALEQDRLRQLVTLFLGEKVFEPVGHAEMDPQDRLLIAVNACLPILNLGIDVYDRWTTVIVYPDEFLVAYEDEEGMTSTIILDGEVAKKALEEQALAEAAADGDAGEDAGDEPPKEAKKPEDVGIETVVMAGDLVFDDPEEAEGGLQIEFGDERDPEIEALKAEVRERDEARAEEEATAIRVTENRRLIGGLVALTLLLAVQGLHFSRAALATMPGIAATRAVP